MLPFCRNCGKELSTEARFCPSCGTPDYVPSVAAPAWQTTQGVAVASRDIGYRSQLTALFVFGVASFFLTVIDGFFGFFTMAAFIASIVRLYQDAKKINRVKGRQVLDAGLWAVAAIFLWIVILPWYLLRGRASALREVAQGRS